MNTTANGTIILTDEIKEKKNLIKTFMLTFGPLKNYNFAVYLAGQSISLTGTWLQITAQGWVVWELSHSAASLGIVAMLSTLPLFLIGPWGGAWADRLDRRKLLIATQLIAMFIALALAALVGTGHIQIWHVYFLALFSGIVNAVDTPAQQAFLGDLTGGFDIQNAINLNSVVLQLSRIIGPALAGIIISYLGMAMAFLINGLSFLAVITSLILVRANQVRKQGSGSPLKDFAGVLKYVKTQPRLIEMLMFISLMTFFNHSIINLYPVIASQVLHGNAKTLGALMSAFGLGALASVIFVVPFVQTFRRPGLIIGAALVWMGLWVIISAFTNSFFLWIVCVVMTWLGAPVVMTTVLGILQKMAPLNMKARLMSLWVMVGFGIQPFGNMLVGLNAEIMGVRTAIIINGTIIIAITLFILGKNKELRNWIIPETTHP